MLVKMSEFLKSLPRKRCFHCGKRIEEQHESYSHLCTHCLDKE